MKKTVCLHNVSIAESWLPSRFKVAARTTTSIELSQTLARGAAHVLIVDLDTPHAMEAVEIARSAERRIGIVGVTAATDPMRIVEALRAGCHQISVAPLDRADLVSAIKRALDESPKSVDPTRVVAVMGAIGGAGATTVASFLAADVAQFSEQRVLLIDLDLEFGNLARFWDAAPNHTFCDLAYADEIDSTLVEKAATELESGIYIVARPPSIEEALGVEGHAVRRVIESSKQVFPHVVLDLPRKIDHVTRSALEVADKLVLVLQCNVPSVDNARRLLKVLERLEFPRSRIEFVMNRANRKIHNVSIDEIEREIAKPLLGAVPNDYQLIADAMDLGQPLSVNGAVRRATRRIAHRLYGDEQNGNGRGGIVKLGRKGLSVFVLFGGTRRKAESAPAPRKVTS